MESAMRKFSGMRKSSVHKTFVYTVEGTPATGWETDRNPRRKASPSNQHRSFIRRKFGGKSYEASHTGSKSNFRSRLLLKSGAYNILGKNIPERRMRYVTDLWNTLIDLKWLGVLFFFLVSLISSWLMFGLVFYLIALVHGDLGNDEPSTDFTPCFANFKNFASAFLYSIETMHTIGYGFRYTTDQCTVAIVAMCLSALVGCCLEAFIVGVVFAKFQMPAQRAQTLMFSKNAVISTRDGRLCLLFRIGNMRKSLIIQLAVRAHLVHHRVTQEGELMPFHQHELIMQLDSMSGNAFSSWPVTACHFIGPDSPIYELNKKSLERSKFEIIVTLEGVVENTGSVLQARTSYTPEEIIWGHSFTRLLTFRKEKGEYIVDFNHFEALEPVKGMLGLSGSELDDNKSLSAPELYESDHQQDPAAPPSPSLSMALSSANFLGIKHIEGHDGSHASRRRRFSKYDPDYVKNIFKPPSPSLARAVSAHTMESMQAMAREYETSMRRFSRASVDHQASLWRSNSPDHLHRSSSPTSVRRLQTMVHFTPDTIQEDVDEITRV